MTISLTIPTYEDIGSYSQRDLKNLFTQILRDDETYGTFENKPHPHQTIKEIEAGKIHLLVDGKKTYLTLDIAIDEAKKLRGKYSKNHFVDLKKGYGKVEKIDTREVTSLVKTGFNIKYKEYFEDVISN